MNSREPYDQEIDRRFDQIARHYQEDTVEPDPPLTTLEKALVPALRMFGCSAIILSAGISLTLILTVWRIL